LHQVSDPISNPILVRIHDLSRGGSGVARLDSGEIVFVPFTAPGDQVRVRILEKNKTYSQGELVEIVEPSSIRVAPRCAVFTRCGGCSWQHLPYSLQFETKKKGVLHALKRAGVSADAVPLDELPAKNPYSYRNRIQLRGTPARNELGFYGKGSSEVVPIERCEIAHEDINETLPRIREEARQKFDREYKVEIESPIRYVFNQKHAAFGFRQINDEQNAVLQTWVAEQAGSGPLLLDLYGGYGNLSRPLVDRFETIHCVDVSVPRERPDSLPESFQFHRSDVRGWLLRQSREPDAVSAATVILDPPREGLGADFSEIEAALSRSFRPEKLILVGCDVDAFARDTHRFLKRGYSLKKLGVLDLFPQTPHVESLALFSK